MTIVTRAYLKDWWNSLADECYWLRSVKLVTNARWRKFEARLREYGLESEDDKVDFLETMGEEIRSVKTWVKEQSFLNFDFIFGPINCPKILEGNYRPPQNSAMNTPISAQHNLKPKKGVKTFD